MDAAGPEVSVAQPPDFPRWAPLNQSLFLSSAVLLEGHLLAAHTDRATMSHGLEARFPFLDHHIVEWCASLAPRLKLRGLEEKWLLRRVAQGLLPPALARRRKKMFLAPFGTPFLSETAPDAVRASLAREVLARQGYFDPDAVGAWVRELRELTVAHPGGFWWGYLARPRHRARMLLLGMGVTFVVSTGIWHARFLGDRTGQRA